MDSFTQLIVQQSPMPISAPVPHSYYCDDNMEAYQIMGPYDVGNERSRDLGSFTGATGPTGHVTPMNQPELTAPQSSSTLQDSRPGGRPNLV
jgi:hypothetical protein